MLYLTTFFCKVLYEARCRNMIMRGAQYDEARWHNVMKQGPRYDEAGEQERGSVFVVVSFFFGLKKRNNNKKHFFFQKTSGTFQLGLSAPKVELQKLKVRKNRSCCCWCICRNRPPQKLRPTTAEQQRVAKPNPAIINYSRKFTQDLFGVQRLTTSG